MSDKPARVRPNWLIDEDTQTHKAASQQILSNGRRQSKKAQAMNRESPLSTKGRAFRWALSLIAGCFVIVGLAFLSVIPLVAAYWLGITLALSAIGAMTVYFIARREGNQ